MKTSSKLAGILALALVVSAGVASVYLSPSLAQVDTRVRERAQQLIQNADRVRLRVEELFQNATGQGIDIPQNATDAKNAGDQALNSAQAEFSAGNYTSAARNAVQALHSYHFAAREVLRLMGEQPTPPAGRGVAIAVSRANRLADRLSDALDELQRAGADPAAVATARSKIEQARAHLAQALQELREEDIPGAAHELGEAHRLLASATADIAQLTKGKGQQRMLNYINALRRRIHSVEQMIERARGHIDEVQIQEAQAHIDAAKTAVDEAENLVSQGQPRLAVAKLGEAEIHIRAAILALSPREGAGHP